MERIFRNLAAKRRLPRHGMRTPPGGLLFMLGTVMIGVAAADGDINLLMAVFGLCVGAVALSLFSGHFALHGLTVKRIVPDVAFAGQIIELRYEVTNNRRWASAKSIHVADLLPQTQPLAMPEAYIPILPPGRTVTLTVPVPARRRGRVRFTAVALATRFPFDLFARFITIAHKQELIIFPALGRLLVDLKTASWCSESSRTGATAARFIGDEEYYGVREYRAGDNPRRIHWRRSAHTGQLMVRQMTRTRNDQLWCVINTRIERGNDTQADRLETAVSCAATIICDALERGIKVGLICNGRPLLVLPPGGGRARRPRLLGELALREPNTDDVLADHLRRVAWPARWRGPCLLFGAAADPELADAERALGQMLGEVSVFVPDTSAFAGLFQIAGPDGRNATNRAGATSDQRRTVGAGRGTG